MAAKPYEVVPDHRLEPKVTASVAGGAAGGAGLAPFLQWLADEVWYGGADALPTVPEPLVGLLNAIAIALPGLLAGFYARHVNREV